MSIKQTIGFTGEIVFFVLTGYFLAFKNYGYTIISLLFAMIIAGYVGNLIKKEALDSKREDITNINI